MYVKLIIWKFQLLENGIRRNYFRKPQFIKEFPIIIVNVLVNGGNIL